MTTAETKELCILVGFVAIAVYVVVREWYDSKRRKLDIILTNDLISKFLSLDKYSRVSLEALFGKTRYLQNQFNEAESRLSKDIDKMNSLYTLLDDRVTGTNVIIAESETRLDKKIEDKIYYHRGLIQEVENMLNEETAALSNGIRAVTNMISDTDLEVTKAKALGKQRGEKFDERLTHIESYLATPRSKRAPLLGEINVSEFMGIDPAKPGSERTVLYNNLTKRMEEF